MPNQHSIHHLIAIWETVPEPDPKAVEKAFLMLFEQVAANEMPQERARISADLTNPDDPLMCERQPLLTTSPND
jgi:hypothetical protein